MIFLFDFFIVVVLVLIVVLDFLFFFYFYLGLSWCYFSFLKWEVIFLIELGFEVGCVVIEYENFLSKGERIKWEDGCKLL